MLASWQHKLPTQSEILNLKFEIHSPSPWAPDEGHSYHTECSRR